MKRGSTLFLRSAIFAIAAVVLAICVFALPAGIRGELDGGGYSPILFGLYVPAIPFFFALYQALKLLTYIDQGKAFSKSSVRTLQLIKYCAVSISALFAAGMPYVFHVADQDDAPGVIVLGLVIVFASAVIAVFAAVLQKLLQEAIAIKSENDLTV